MCEKRVRRQVRKLMSIKKSCGPRALEMKMKQAAKEKKASRRKCVEVVVVDAEANTLGINGILSV